VSRVAELRARRDLLLLRSDSLRRQLVRHGEELEGAFSSVDRGINLVRAVSGRPLVLAAGAGVLFALGPRKALHWVSRGLFFTSMARRAFGLLAARRSRPQLPPPGTDLFV
jgi:hypothetical protein